jgi:hypothetical protein
MCLGHSTLTTRLGYGADENQNPKVFGCALFILFFWFVLCWVDTGPTFVDLNLAAGNECSCLSVFDRKPNPCNDNIYHFHVSESLNFFVLNLHGG